MIRWLAEPGDPRERLDHAVVFGLARAGAPASRAAVQRWIDHGRVQVNGLLLRANARVAAGAVIEVAPEPPPPSAAEPQPEIALAVVYEDPHLLVIDKPAGLVVHPARGHARGTLVNALLGRPGFDAAAADPSDPMGHARPGIVHRLDKGTSGLLVVAKSEAAREALKRLFATHDIERIYEAIVIGTARERTFDTLHGRHPNDRLRWSTHVTKGRRAVTHVTVEEHFAGASRVTCRLETGRTHQIRVHLAESAGTPVLGDPLYGKVPRDPFLRSLAKWLGHPALHARVLGFRHPVTGAMVRWESPLPVDIATVLRKLRAEAALEV